MFYYINQRRTSSSPNELVKTESGFLDQLRLTYGDKCL